MSKARQAKQKFKSHNQNDEKSKNEVTKICNEPGIDLKNKTKILHFGQNIGLESSGYVFKDIDICRICTTMALVSKCK